MKAFVNRRLRRILRIFWPYIIANNELWERTGQTPIRIEIKQRKWLGRTPGKLQDDVTRHGIEWSPQRSRRRRKPPIETLA